MARKTKRANKAKAAQRRKATKPPNETALVRLCVTYAQSIGAYNDGFKADSDGNNKHAEALGHRYRNRARESLTKIAAMRAITQEGLCAKARIVRVVFNDNEGGSLEPLDQDFLISFSADVEEFLQPICDGKVKIQSAATATEGGASCARLINTKVAS